jgi:predicted secreted hydrolase
VLSSRILVFLLIGAVLLFWAAPAICARKFKLALPGYKFSFPADHASHDEFKTEWWYYTGHLQSKDSRKFGYELTFFRSAVDIADGVKNSNWKLDNVYMAHFALTDLNGKRFYYDEVLNRPALGLAGAKTDKYEVWNGPWSARLDKNKHLLAAKTKDYAIDLTLVSSKPPVEHGKNGVSQKASCKGCASHYYSLTRMKTDGTVTLNKQEYKVVGNSWMDHEFGSNQLTAEQVGWDWFSIQLEDGIELMLYIMRKADGTIDENSSATVVNPDGKSDHLTRDQFTIKATDYWTSPKTKGKYPSGWEVRIPSWSIDLKVAPELKDQELVTDKTTAVTYWEGACAVTGTRLGRRIEGDAYVELTGYAETFKKKI